jgi:hypothetical protein
MVSDSPDHLITEQMLSDALRLQRTTKPDNADYATHNTINNMLKAAGAVDMHNPAVILNDITTDGNAGMIVARLCDITTTAAVPTRAEHDWWVLAQHRKDARLTAQVKTAEAEA